MAEPFRFELVSPQKLLFSGEVESVVAPGTEGEFTVLKDHAPFMSTLRPGWVKITGGEKIEDLYVRGGFADVAPDGCTILADYAVPQSELEASMLDDDIETAEKAVDDAKGHGSRQRAMEERDRLKEFQASLGR